MVVEASEVDRESIVGDEAHIISDSPNGPRAQAGSRENLDRYENAILLCKSDHKMIDDQPSTYTAADLQTMKLTHERWVDVALDVAEKAKAGLVADLAVTQRDPHAERRRQMARFGPSDWCPMPDTNGPELILRCVAALPAQSFSARSLQTFPSVGLAQKLASRSCRMRWRMLRSPLTSERNLQRGRGPKTEDGKCKAAPAATS